MKPTGKILKLFTSTSGNSKRDEHKELILDEKGIIGDKFYDKNLDRSILLTSTESYQLARSNQIKINFGELGENLLIDYNPYHLPTGTQLKIGDVILEITQNCTICNHLSKIDKKLPKLLAHDRGIFVKVTKGGKLQLGDPIYLL